MSMARLYLEEMKGLARGRFALAGAGAAMGFIAFVAAVIAPEQLRAFGVVAYLVVPNFIFPFAAARISGTRATRFTHSLFTAPVTQAQWLAANVLVCVSVGLLYLAATAPVLGVVAIHVGTSGELFQDLLPIALGIVLVGSAIGTLIGVAFTGRAVAAPVGLATSIALVSVMSGVFMSQVLQAQTPNAVLVRILHLLPHPNLLDAVSSEVNAGKAPADPMTAVVSLVALGLGALLLAAWIYLREQGPEDWEGQPRRRALLALVAAGILLAPAALASDDYVDVEPSQPQVHVPGPRPVNVLAAIGEPGARVASLDFVSPNLNTMDDPLVASRPNARELVLILPVDPAIPVRDLRVEVTIPSWPEEGNDLWESASFATVRPDETAPLPGAVLGEAAEGIVVRVPLTIEPRDPHSFSKNFYAVHVHATYEVEGEEKPRAAHAEVPIHAAVDGAATHMALASIPIPILLAAAAGVRRWRVER